MSSLQKTYDLKHFQYHFKKKLCWCVIKHNFYRKTSWPTHIWKYSQVTGGTALTNTKYTNFWHIASWIRPCKKCTPAICLTTGAVSVSMIRSRNLIQINQKYDCLNKFGRLTSLAFEPVIVIIYVYNVWYFGSSRSVYLSEVQNYASIRTRVDFPQANRDK